MPSCIMSIARSKAAPLSLWIALASRCCSRGPKVSLAGGSLGVATASLFRLRVVGAREGSPAGAVVISPGGVGWDGRGGRLDGVDFGKLRGAEDGPALGATGSAGVTTGVRAGGDFELLAFGTDSGGGMVDRDEPVSGDKAENESCFDPTSSGVAFGVGAC